jgi:transposase-like protein
MIEDWEPGLCPRCKGGSLEYLDASNYDGGRQELYKCDDCQTEFTEYYSVTYLYTEVESLNQENQ